MAIKNPYPGFEKQIYKPFSKKTSDYFFGRNQDVRLVLELLRRNHFAAVLSQSKGGKTSFLEAGIKTTLQKDGFHARLGKYWKVVNIKQYNTLIGALARAISAKDILFETRVKPFFEDEVLETLSKNDNGLIHVFEDSELSLKANLLLIIDDFSDCFDSRFEEEDRHRFFNLLINATKEEELSIYVLVTINKSNLRTKPYARYPELMSMIRKSQYPLHLLTEAELAEAIRNPAASEGALIDDKLCDRIIQDIGQLENQLPLLQERMHKTWIFWSAESGKTKKIKISLPHYLRGTGLDLGVDIHRKGAKSKAKKEEIVKTELEEIVELNVPEITLGATEFEPMEVIFQSLSTSEQKKAIRIFQLLNYKKEADSKPKSFPISILAKAIEMKEKALNTLIQKFEKSIVISENHAQIIDDNLLENWDRMHGWLSEEIENVERYLNLTKAAHEYFVEEKGMEFIWTKEQFERTKKWKEKFRPNEFWAALHDPNFDRAMDFLEVGLYEIGVTSTPPPKRVHKPVEVPMPQLVQDKKPPKPIELKSTEKEPEPIETPPKPVAKSRPKLVIKQSSPPPTPEPKIEPEPPVRKKIILRKKS